MDSVHFLTKPDIGGGPKFMFSVGGAVGSIPIRGWQLLIEVLGRNEDAVGPDGGVTSAAEFCRSTGYVVTGDDSM
jgi:hypothetical protein